MTQNELAKKLQLKPDHQVVVANTPAGYSERLGIRFGTELSGKPDSSVDFIQVFVKSRQEVEKLAPLAMKVLKYDGFLWISYLKGGSKVKTDLNRDILWNIMKDYGMSGISMVSVDDVWSAMRFRPSEKVGK